MSGILENIFAELQAINSKLDAHSVVGSQVQGAGAQLGSGANVTPPAGVSAPAQTPTLPVSAAPQPGADVDKRGFPHDERIHAGTKNKNADGTWKVKPGIDRAVLIPQVEAELRSQGWGNDEPPATAPVAPGVAPTPAPTPGAAAPVPPPATAAGAPALPGLPPTPPAVVAPPAKVDFPEVASEEDMDDNALTQTAAAMLSRYGADKLAALLGKFEVPEGGTAMDIAPGFKFVFWQYASNEDYLSQLGII